MQISLNTQSLQANSNFKAAYIVHGVYLKKGLSQQAEYFGNKRKDTVYEVARILTNGMYKKTLSEDIKPLVKKFFPDFEGYPFVMVARTPGPRYLQEINILTADDAQEYKNTTDMLRIEDYSKVSDKEKRENSEMKAEVLSNILKRNGNKQIIISAQENDGEITITNIEHSRKSQRPQRYR